jgi:aspartate-semialdehyde dehydrogenase
MGATGLVGQEMLRILEERSFPVGELRAYASPRSEGRALAFGDSEVTCEVLRDGCFDGLDLVIVDVDDPIALEWAPVAAAAGATVIDNSAAFRMEPDVPLVVAEINPEDLRSLPRGIASCPNCTTMVLVTGLAPLHRAAGIERMVVSTYQSVSGAGTPGIRELDEQWTKGAGEVEAYRRAGATGAVAGGEVWDRPIAGNVIPLAGSLREGGYTSEEVKLVNESRKILHAPDMRVTVTCVRVPVYVGHAMSANVQFGRAVSRAEAVELLTDAPGVQLAPDGADGSPTSLDGAGIDPVLVGRIRQDESQPNTLNLWVTGDNLRKGAALNAVQMAELLP